MDPRKISALIFATVVFALGVAIMLLAMSAGHADHAPRVTADGVIIHGDWGLYRPGHMAPWAEVPVYLGGPYVIGAPIFKGGVRQFFPSNRTDAGAYRRRPPVDRQPIPAEPYYRSWGAQSQNLDPNSATVYAPFEPPSVIYAPSSDRRHR